MTSVVYSTIVIFFFFVCVCCRLESKLRGSAYSAVKTVRILQKLVN